MTRNKDRKQTKYGHKRQEQMTRTTEPWHNSPLPEGVSHAVTVPPGRGGWALWRPLRTNTDRNTGRGPPERNRWRRPWRSWSSEAMACRSSGGHGGAGSSGGHDGAGSSGGHDGAGSSGGHGGTGSSGGHGRWSLWPWPRSPRPGPYSRNPFYPPPQNFPGEVRGYQEPSGARHTEHDKTPGPDKQDRTSHRNQKPSWLAWKLRLPLGMTKSQRPSQGPSATASISTTRGRRLEWPPWPQQEEPPAPDESPWTRQDMVL